MYRLRQGHTRDHLLDDDRSHDADEDFDDTHERILTAVALPERVVPGWRRRERGVESARSEFVESRDFMPNLKQRHQPRHRRGQILKLLNLHPEQVEDTRHRVIHEDEDVGYRPNDVEQTVDDGAEGIQSLRERVDDLRHRVHHIGEGLRLFQGIHEERQGIE